jgi:hypothetical protein
MTLSQAKFYTNNDSYIISEDEHEELVYGQIYIMSLSNHKQTIFK